MNFLSLKIKKIREDMKRRGYALRISQKLFQKLDSTIDPTAKVKLIDVESLKILLLCGRFNG